MYNKLAIKTRLNLSLLRKITIPSQTYNSCLLFVQLSIKDSQSSVCVYRFEFNFEFVFFINPLMHEYEKLFIPCFFFVIVVLLTINFIF